MKHILFDQQKSVPIHSIIVVWQNGERIANPLHCRINVHSHSFRCRARGSRLGAFLADASAFLAQPAAIHEKQEGSMISGQEDSALYVSEAFVHLRSEEHTSELQSHSFISYAVFCLNKKTHVLTPFTFLSLVCLLNV